MWTGTGYYSWIFYDFYGSGYSPVKGSIFRQELILEPLNILLYTWRFLATLKREEEHSSTKKAFHWYATLTDWTVHFLYYCFFVAQVVVQTYRNTYYDQGDADEVAHWQGILVGLDKSLGYLITFTNCLACFTMVLIDRFARKLSQLAVAAFRDGNGEGVQE